MFAVLGLVCYSLLLIQKQDEDVKQRSRILIVDNLDSLAIYRIHLEI
jgi:hypothetical protein